VINPELVRVTGLLSPFREGFGAWLETAGYSRKVCAVHLRLMGDLSCWLGEREETVAGLSTPLLAEFIAGRRAAGQRTGLSVRALRPLAEYLRGTGAVLAEEPAPPSGPVEEAIAEYASYLRAERGLAAGTIEHETVLVRPFLAGRVREGGFKNLESLTAADVQAFVLDRARSASPARVQRTGTALRSLLRFLHLRGVTASPLAGAVPTAAGWKLSGLPRHLTQQEAARMVESCDLATVTGRRDRAVLLLLARMGLRAGEAAGLRLDDIDWRSGEITVRGKGSRHERLPLPPDVGEALASYLRDGRPARGRSREVFAGVRAPHRPLTRGAVTQIAARASQRCGLGTVFAHRLRHTAAAGMLRGGASLEEIGQVLRHQRTLTTAIYAKVDYDGLRGLARPWPGDAA
jgi:site-specific recombinase XerD